MFENIDTVHAVGYAFAVYLWLMILNLIMFGFTRWYVSEKPKEVQPEEKEKTQPRHMGGTLSVSPMDRRERDDGS